MSYSLDEQQLAVHFEALRRDLFAHVEERQELPDRYAFRIPGITDMKHQVDAFVDTKRAVMLVLADRADA